jgi:hypothetical protein
MFKYPLLYRIQSEMVPVKNLLGPLKVKIVFRIIAPGQFKKEMDIVYLNRIFS